MKRMPTDLASMPAASALSACGSAHMWRSRRAYLSWFVAVSLLGGCTIDVSGSAPVFATTESAGMESPSAAGPGATGAPTCKEPGATGCADRPEAGSPPTGPVAPAPGGMGARPGDAGTPMGMNAPDAGPLADDGGEQTQPGSDDAGTPSMDEPPVDEPAPQDAAVSPDGSDPGDPGESDAGTPGGDDPPDAGNVEDAGDEEPMVPRGLLRVPDGIRRNDPIEIEFEHPEGHPLDWVGLYELDDDADEEDDEEDHEDTLEWDYLGDEPTGRLTFRRQRDGRYELRLFADDTFQVIYRLKFTIRK